MSMRKIIQENFYGEQRRLMFSLIVEYDENPKHKPKRKIVKYTDPNGLDFGTEYKKRFGKPSDNIKQYKEFYYRFRKYKKFPW